MSSEPLEREIAVAHDIALEAVAVVASFVGRQVRVDSKAGNEPVTEADHAANEVIVRRLSAEFPQDAILSEEIPDDRSRLGARRVWMVDPIDGTSDFILGHAGFAVMIGLAIDGRPALGVVSQPPTGKTYSGVVGIGAWLDRPGEARLPLRTSALAGPPGIRLVASKTHRTPRIDAIRRELQIDDEINIGSIGLKIGLVAEATRDLYVYTGGRTKIWDTCGPEAVLVAAGGRVTDMFGAPLEYASPDLYNRRGIVASNGPLHAEVIARIAPHLAPKAD
jgi:3'(2'), 5'-bisphosphate nucleotidase